MKISPVQPSVPSTPLSTAVPIAGGEVASSAPVAGDRVDLAASGGTAPSAPLAGPPIASARRDPLDAVRFCDAFNSGEHLAPADLLDKQNLMVSNPLKFARCMPALFMSDILGPFADLAKLSDRPAPVVWIDGDAHPGNFGIIAGTDGHAVWGLNDYDMTCQGSPAMDLDRFAFALLTEMRQKGIEPGAVVDALGRSYLGEMKQIAHGSDPPMAYLTRDEASGAIQKRVAKSDAIKRHEWIQQFASKDGHNNWHFIHSEELEPVDLSTSNKIVASLHEYDARQGATPSVARPLHILGVAQKLQSGGSSHGQPRYFALVENARADKPPIILEVKQELPAPLKGWNGDCQQAARASAANWTGDIARADAEQIVHGEAAMGGAANPLTGATRIDGLAYLVREREPCKASLSEKHLLTTADFQSLAEQAGRVLARAHGRSPELAQQIVEWAGKADPFCKRLDAFAQAYSTQAVADCNAYRAAHPQASPAVGAMVPDLGD